MEGLSRESPLVLQGTVSVLPHPTGPLPRGQCPRQKGLPCVSLRFQAHFSLGGPVEASHNKGGYFSAVQKVTREGPTTSLVFANDIDHIGGARDRREGLLWTQQAPGAGSLGSLPAPSLRQAALSFYSLHFLVLSGKLARLTGRYIKCPGITR